MQFKQCLVIGACLVIGFSSAHGQINPQVLTDMGYFDLIARIGDPNLLPDGSGVDIMHVEAPNDAASNYLPDPNNFDPNITFLDGSGFGTMSGHATVVGNHIYAPNGLVPLIDTVESFEANDWLGSGFLHTLNTTQPQTIDRTVTNHSWVATFADQTIGSTFYTGDEIGEDVLRRLDFAIDRDDKVVVAGVTNTPGQPIDHIFGNAYNIITATISDGAQTGPTTLDLPGRSKPDLAASASNTSNATGVISGAALFMQDLAQGDTDGQHAYSTKAFLMAGATKTEFDLTNSTVDPNDDWTHTTTQPLDLQSGVGELNIDKSHLIYTAGKQEASSVSDVGLVGWDAYFATFIADNQYFIDVPTNELITDMSIVLVWNREVTPVVNSPALDWNVHLANLDLELYEATGFTTTTLMEQSVSAVDNVEHIWRRGIMGRRMAIEVSIDPNDIFEEYTLAWRIETVVPLAGDVNLDGVVDIADLAVVGSHWNATGADWFWGDLNADGVVDIADMGIIGANWTSPGGSSFSTGGGSFDEALDDLGLPTGDAANGAGGPTAIPAPPAAVSLTLLAALGLTRRRRSH